MEKRRPPRRESGAKWRRSPPHSPRRQRRRRPRIRRASSPLRPAGKDRSCRAHSAMLRSAVGAKTHRGPTDRRAAKLREPCAPRPIGNREHCCRRSAWPGMRRLRRATPRNACPCSRRDRRRRARRQHRPDPTALSSPRRCMTRRKIFPDHHAFVRVTRKQTKEHAPRKRCLPIPTLRPPVPGLRLVREARRPSRKVRARTSRWGPPRRCADCRGRCSECGDI